MTKYFRVAEHNFAITAPDAIFASLPNYEPFELSIQPENLLYHLTVNEPVDALDTDTSAFEPVYVESLIRTEPNDLKMPRLDIYRNADKWLILEATDKQSPFSLRVEASADFSEAILDHTLPQTVDPQAQRSPVRFAVDNAAMLLFAFASAKYATLEMHASVTVRGDYGYLFLGKSGTGKSTHSQQWMKAFPDAWLLNDDNPVVRLKPDGVYVYGSPWSGKTPCYKNDVRRVGAFVKLLQAPYNKVHTLKLPEAYAYVLSSASGLKIVSEVMDVLFDTISTIIQTAPVYGLECLPDTAAAELCAQTIMPKI